MAEDHVEVLSRIDKKLGAVLAIVIDEHLRATPELAKPRPRSIDRLLSDVGLSGAEIAALLGKTPQAVSQVLGKDRKKVSTASSSNDREDT